MPISNIQTDETYTPMKKYLFLTLLAAAFLAGGGCSSSDDDGWGVIELASPKLKVTTELATATVTWDAVAKTAGYAYALDGAADYTSVDAATTTVTLTALAEGGHTFRLKAVGDLDHTTDSAERTIDFEIDPTLPQPAPTYVKGASISSAQRTPSLKISYDNPLHKQGLQPHAPEKQALCSRRLARRLQPFSSAPH